MRITIRLYKKQDLDLMILDRNPDFSLVTAISTIVNAYVKGENKMVMLPDSSPWMAYSNLPRMTQLHITFTEEDDGPEVIHFLKSVLPNMRNNMIKNLVRSYMVGSNLSFYFKDGEEHITDMDFSDVQIVSIEKRTEKNVLKSKRDIKKTKLKAKKSAEKEDIISVPDFIEEKNNLIAKNDTEETISNKTSVIKDVMKEKINRTDIIEDSNISETENEVLNKENFELETSSVNKEKAIELPIGESSVKEDFTPQNIETDDDFDIFGSLDKMLENF